jgi:endonuclease IV
MVTRPPRLLVESQLVSQLPVSFIEVPVHDYISKLSLKQFQQYFRISEDFRGYVVIHSEGETDGRARIGFSSPALQEREAYVNDLAQLMSTVHGLIQEKLRAIIVHPGTYHRKYARDLQIKWLSESLIKLSELLPETQLCIESRGGDRQGKVLRSIPNDIIELDHFLKESGAKVSHCFDLAQAFTSFGIKGVTNGFQRLMENSVLISEIHASDVADTKRGHRISVEVGKGSIPWSSLTQLLENFDGRVLLEVIGGITPFKRSLEFLVNLNTKGEKDAIILPNS